MANPTTNFGWVMPTSTDLVTDLPADFAVFGQAVDTSLMDLKGGTTGQVLSKASNTDMDFTWTTDASGDFKLISTTTFSNVASQLITGLTTTYTNYFLIGRLAASTGLTLRGRFSVSGSPATASSYSYATYGKTSGNSDVSLAATSAAYFEIATMGSDSQYLNMNIFNPNQTSYRKAATWQHTGLNSAYSPVYFDGGAWLDIAGTAYNEIQFIASTGNISGVVSLYGYNK